MREKRFLHFVLSDFYVSNFDLTPPFTSVRGNNTSLKTTFRYSERTKGSHCKISGRQTNKYHTDRQTDGMQRLMRPSREGRI